MNKIKIFFSIAAIVFALSGCGQNYPTKKMIETKNISLNSDTATFGAGCFWCVEAIFQQLQGVEKVSSGFAGGSVKNPSYKEVCNGTTGHAEVCNIIYNPKEISFEDLCQIFFTIHDPTQLNRQGNDVGTQYRSAIFYHSNEQKYIAEKVKKELDDSKKLDTKVVTEIVPFTIFYSAEDYHQDYYNLNKDGNQYCSFVITPKLEKFKKTWHEKMKKE